MRTLCPNLENEEGLETVLEVPIPEETFNISNNTKSSSSWQSMKSWMKPHAERSSPTSVIGGRSSNDIQLMLGVVGAPLIPLPVSSDHAISNNFKHHPIEVAMAKYIVQQYIAATGGEKALNSIDSMCATGKLKMETSDNFVNEDDNLSLTCNVISNNRKVKSPKNGGEVGGFVFWQKRPDLWCLELVVSGYKFSAGSDGKVAWRQTPWHRPHASRGPPRPLRRSFQGLDPKSTANLFSNSICVGEKTINDEDCFVLKLQAEPSTLKARSSNNVEIIQHIIWGYFSQRTGLLIKLDDSHLLKIKAKIPENDNIFLETTMQSLVQDYKTIEGINIAHSGQTSVSLSRFGESSESHSKTRMLEVWEIEEVDFNIKGLSMDCFLPPGDLKMEVRGGVVGSNVVNNSATIPFRTRANPTRDTD